MNSKSINIEQKFSLFEKLWTPHIIGEMNNQYIKLAKLNGEFVWHRHDDEDELFLVIKGTLYIDFRDSETVEINEGEIYIVSKGIEHKPHTKGETVQVMLIEPKSTLHTGNIESDITVKDLDWI